VRTPPEETHLPRRLDRAGGLLLGGHTAGERARRLSLVDPASARFLRGEAPKNPLFASFSLVFCVAM
jgi:hypothetical protein